MNKFKKVFIPFVIFGIILGIFELVVIPMVNASNTILNIIGVMVGFITGFFTYSYVGVLINGVPPSDGEINPPIEIKENPKTKKNGKVQ